MNLTVIGAGYVGLATAVYFLSKGHSLRVYDNNREKINILRNGKSPIKEQGMSAAIEDGVRRKSLSFYDKPDDAFANCDGVFIAVGTPSLPDGTADISGVFSAFAAAIQYSFSNLFIVNKSTAPVGTVKALQNHYESILKEKDSDREVYVGCNPEFLRAGHAVEDYENPARIIIGADNEKTRKWICSLYGDSSVPRYCVSSGEAEMIKYVSNTFLALKIGFVNEISTLCEACSCDMSKVLSGVTADPRIGSEYMQPGPGFGGSCLPKDTRALVNLAALHRCDTPILDAIPFSNQLHIERWHNRIKRLKGERIAILGLTFKSGTDDIRESYGVKLVESLATDKRYEFRIFDTELPEMSDIPPLIAVTDESRLILCANEYDAATTADILVITIDWRTPIDWCRIKELMCGNMVVDLRKSFIRRDIEEIGLQYLGTGQGV